MSQITKVFVLFSLSFKLYHICSKCTLTHLHSKCSLRWKFFFLMSGIMENGKRIFFNQSNFLVWSRLKKCFQFSLTGLSWYFQYFVGSKWLSNVDLLPLITFKGQVFFFMLTTINSDPKYYYVEGIFTLVFTKFTVWMPSPAPPAPSSNWHLGWPVLIGCSQVAC